MEIIIAAFCRDLFGPCSETLFNHVCRISLTGVCRMDLRKYPLDTQTCAMNIMSCKLYSLLRLLQQIHVKKKKKQEMKLLFIARSHASLII